MKWWWSTAAYADQPNKNKKKLKKSNNDKTVNKENRMMAVTRPCQETNHDLHRQETPAKNTGTMVKIPCRKRNMLGIIGIVLQEHILLEEGKATSRETVCVHTYVCARARV